MISGESQDNQFLWDHDILFNIRMIYINNPKDLIFLMGSIHLLEPRPTAIVIDDFSSILLSNLPAPSVDDHKFTDKLVTVLAHVEDAFHFIKESLNSAGSSVAPLLVLVECNGNPYHLQLLTRHASLVLEMQRRPSEEVIDIFSVELKPRGMSVHHHPSRLLAATLRHIRNRFIVIHPPLAGNVLP
jgi:hypothetical protein